MAFDEDFMRAALAEAEKAREAGEVPVGAVLCVDDEIVGRGFNRPITACDPTAHAEVVALRDAAARLGNYRLTGSALYVTVEPCLMCLGAMLHARIGRLVYGTCEPRSGAVGGTVVDGVFAGHNHRFEVVSDVLADDCRALVQAFFRERR